MRTKRYYVMIKARYQVRKIYYNKACTDERFCQNTGLENILLLLLLFLRISYLIEIVVFAFLDTLFIPRVYLLRLYKVQIHSFIYNGKNIIECAFFSVNYVMIHY